MSTRMKKRSAGSGRNERPVTLALPDLAPRFYRSGELQPAGIRNLGPDERKTRFAEWVSKRVRPRMWFTAMPGVWIEVQLPAGASELQLREWAREMSDLLPSHFTVVAPDRRVSIAFESGKERERHRARPGQINVPYMTVGGSRRLFTMHTSRTPDSLLRSLRRIGERRGRGARSARGDAKP